MIHPLTLAFIASTLLFSACDKQTASTAAPLPLVGTRGIIAESMLRPALDAADVVADNSSSTHLCQVSTGTPIRSVHNAKDKHGIHVILEEDSPEDMAYVRLIHSPFMLCTKGTVIELGVSTFTQAVDKFKNERMEPKKI